MTNGTLLSLAPYCARVKPTSFRSDSGERGRADGRGARPTKSQRQSTAFGGSACSQMWPTCLTECASVIDTCKRCCYTWECDCHVGLGVLFSLLEYIPPLTVHCVCGCAQMLSQPAYLQASHTVMTPQCCSPAFTSRPVMAVEHCLTVCIRRARVGRIVGKLLSSRLRSRAPCSGHRGTSFLHVRPLMPKFAVSRWPWSSAPLVPRLKKKKSVHSLCVFSMSIGLSVCHAHGAVEQMQRFGQCLRPLLPVD